MWSTLVLGLVILCPGLEAARGHPQAILTTTRLGALPHATQAGGHPSDHSAAQHQEQEQQQQEQQQQQQRQYQRQQRQLQEQSINDATSIQTPGSQAPFHRLSAAYDHHHHHHHHLSEHTSTRAQGHQQAQGLGQQQQQRQQQEQGQGQGQEQEEQGQQERASDSLGGLAPLRVDKRSWSPRAVKAQSGAAASQQEEAISLLLDEVASLDLDAANESNGRRVVGARQSAQGPDNDETLALASQSRQQLLNAVGNRMRARSTSNAGGMPSFHADASHGATGNFPRRASNRHLPCFFNAITCF